MFYDHVQKWTLNPRIYVYLRKFLQEADLPAVQVRALQLSRLKRLLEDASREHEFYRERFHAAGFDPATLRSVEEMQALPSLGKDEYRDFIRDTIARDPDKYRNWYQDRTSGSTGIPLNFPRTWDERASMCAKWMRALTRMGYHWRDVTFSLPSPDRMQKDSVLQRMGLFQRHSLHFNSAVEDMVSLYQRVRPTVVYANKSQLALMADHVQRHGIPLFPPRLCVVAGEILDAPSRRLIEETFGRGGLRQVYATVETSNLAWQESLGSPYRVSHTTNLVETVPEAGSGVPGGRCLVTDFFIRSFPLIRYDVGDWVEPADMEGLMGIRDVKGRANDWLLLPGGGKKSAHWLYHPLGKIQGLQQFRVVQERIDFVRVEVVQLPEHDRNEVEQALRRELEGKFSPHGIGYKIEWKDRLCPDPNGKRRMLICEVEGHV